MSHDLFHDRHLFFHNADGVSDLALQPVRRHDEVALDLLLHGIIAELHVGGSASRAQVLRGKLLQAVEVTSTLVVLEVTRFTVLEGRVALDAILRAQGLPLPSAVHVRNERSRVAAELIHQLVPIGLQLLAVAAPRGKELDEDTLPCRLGIPILLAELDGREFWRRTPANERTGAPLLEAEC